MSDLRSACIEAMAEAMPNRCAFVEDVTPAFDALLGVLEEHANELADISIPTDVRGLLAVLREDK